MFDLKTLFYTSFCITSVMCLLNFLTWRANKNIPGTLLYVFYPILVLAALTGFFTHSQHGHFNQIGLAIGYNLLFAASVVQALALYRFFEFNQFSLRIFLYLTVLLSLLISWSLFFSESLPLRILIYDLQRVFEGLFLSYLFIQVALKRYPNASIIYLLHFSLLITVFTIRSLWLRDLESSAIIKNNWFSIAILFIGIVTPMFYATGIAVLCNERRSEHLKKLTEKAQKDAELRGLFLSTMSHEIRTPLNGILGSAQLIMHQTRDSQNKRYCEAIINSAESLNVLVDNVLNFATVDQSSDTLNEEDVELKPYLESICLLSNPVAEQKRIEFKFNFNLPEKSCYYCDQQRLRQVLHNLLNNAIKFTDKGEVSIEVELIRSTALEHTLKFSVHDSGPGIEEEEIEYLTEPYFQNSTGKSKGGTGLGLAITSRILAKLGSQLEIKSELGKGSIFSFTLTLGLGELSLVEQRHHSSHYLTGLSILLVEDLPLNQKIAIELMATDEHKVKLANDGQSAIELMQRYQFDVILLDMNLPDFTGQEVIKRLKLVEHKNQRTPILAFTASVSADEIEEYLKLGIKNVVAKPIKQAKLRKALADSQKAPVPLHTLNLNAILYDTSAAQALESTFDDNELSAIYNEFVLSARSKLNRCEELIEADPEQCIKILHRQASTALQLGFNLYGMELKKLERRLLDNKLSINLEHAIELWQQSLAQYLKHVRSTL
ncbi:hypothetical protein PULV_a2537 [Pseudoalteromonas ulvae UL12]|uniref:histidine kinase n=1 Tax=Pseudoalteromonas ulvae TaxID=107327 RepID=A0A2C9ZZB4_PSEDV|nr:ATP-binding protein [Pseudoalteromonas ulvae]MBE0364773.1 hypothetical protein [Pseudoalteromonas ulvae UL12]OUL56104.1 hybrid sensor histidine kinase/response regulator [Pseudoalteromonas ulvae]